MERFNHDLDAAGYDADVLNEANPIRAGYRELLTWMSESASVTAGSRVLDLGAGTGNLGRELSCFRELVCVDVSRKMIEIGKRKLSDRPGVSWVLSDLIEFFDDPGDPFDIVLSSYSIHHLTSDEKALLFEKIRDVLVPGGRAVFGDLMFESAEARRRKLGHYRSTGNEDLAEKIEDEFFWNLDETLGVLTSLGFETVSRQFSELSWGVQAVRSA